jgi:hypothetical protein
MPDSSYFREKAEQALRLARQNTDPMLIKNLQALGANTWPAQMRLIARCSVKTRKTSEVAQKLLTGPAPQLTNFSKVSKIDQRRTFERLHA